MQTQQVLQKQHICASKNRTSRTACSHSVRCPRCLRCVLYLHGTSTACNARCMRRYDVFGVFMRNWDESEETGNDNCSVEADFAQAQAVCRHIGIPLHEVSFVRQYWTQVFSDFLVQVRRSAKMHCKYGLLCTRLVRLCFARVWHADLGHLCQESHHVDTQDFTPSDGCAVRGGRDSQPRSCLQPPHKIGGASGPLQGPGG
jgi:hypothetical protein